MHWFTNVILTSRAQATSCVINLQELRHTLPQVVERPKVVLCHHMPCFSCHLVPLEGLVEVDLHSLPLTVAGNYCIMCNPPLIVTLPLVFYVYIYIYTIYIYTELLCPPIKGTQVQNCILERSTPSRPCVRFCLNAFSTLKHHTQGIPWKRLESWEAAHAKECGVSSFVFILCF